MTHTDKEIDDMIQRHYQLGLNHGRQDAVIIFVIVLSLCVVAWFVIK